MIGLISVVLALCSMLVAISLPIGVDGTTSPITIGKSTIETGFCAVTFVASVVCLIGVDWVTFVFSAFVCPVSFVRISLGRPTVNKIVFNIIMQFFGKIDCK